MTRTYASIVIILLVLILDITGNYLVEDRINGFVAEMNAVQADAKNGDFESSEQKARSLAQNFENKKHLLELFIKRDYIANLDININGLYAYANEDTEKDLYNEIDKARAQMLSMQHLFFRIV
ncbi:MAG: DUF4363 family protein [Oscillospiraceae bacterium]